MESSNWAATESAQLQPAPRYDLRPLSIGEVLDRTFSVYRSRFWLFAGIAVLSASVQLAGNALTLIVAHGMIKSYGMGSANLVRVAGQYVVALVAFLFVALIQAATVWALGEVYLGRSTTVGASLRAVRGKWFRYLGVVLWQLGSAVWVLLVLSVPAFGLVLRGRSNPALAVAGGLLFFVALAAGSAWGIFAYLRNALGVQTAVIEQLTVRQSMRRSKQLTKGAKGKIFVVLLVAGALLYVAAGLEMPFALLWLRSPEKEHVLGQAVILLINFVSNTLVTPVAMIGLSLVYFDQRIRKEGFDLVMMLGAEPSPAAAHAGGPLDQSPAYSGSRFATEDYPQRATLPTGQAHEPTDGPL